MVTQSWCGSLVPQRWRFLYLIIWCLCSYRKFRIQPGTIFVAFEHLFFQMFNRIMKNHTSETGAKTLMQQLQQYTVLKKCIFKAWKQYTLKRKDRINKSHMDFLEEGSAATLPSVLPHAYSEPLWLTVKIKYSTVCRLEENVFMQKTWNLIQDAILSNLILFQIWYFFERQWRKFFMHEHTWHDEPISVKLFFLVLLPKRALEMQVCAPKKTNKDKSLCLIIKSGIMIALCGDVSQMYY